MVKETNIFIVGIKGVAMTNLALMLKKMGKIVSGSDVDEEFITDDLLKKNNIDWISGFSAADLSKETDLVIYGAAHEGINNPQVKEAQKLGIKVISQAEFLGELSRLFGSTIAVCGCHGKTTTASLLSYALIQLGVKPSYLVGSSGFNKFDGGDYHNAVSGSYFVVEADEYGVNPPFNLTPKFHFLKPKYIICTNIDFDHPDVYKNIDETKESFKKFFEQNEKKLFICSDDDYLTNVIKKFNRKKYINYGFKQNADYQIVKFETMEMGSSFMLVNPNKRQMNFFISLYGEKNVSNAAGVIVCLLNLGFSEENIRQAIKDFTGAKRRFEKVVYLNKVYLFDDYGHHPNEIKATIEAARLKFPDRRLIIIFQPHTYSRTQSFLKDFASCLALADLSLILPIFPSAREEAKDFEVSAKDIVRVAKSDHVLAVDSKEELLAKLKSILAIGDVVFTMGAGDVYKLHHDIITIIKKTKI